MAYTVWGLYKMTQSDSILCSATHGQYGPQIQQQQYLLNTGPEHKENTFIYSDLD